MSEHAVALPFERIITTPVVKRHRDPLAGLVVRRISCADGVTLSIQASHLHYCFPRDDFGPWSSVEVGMPSVKPPRSWRQYAEIWSDPTGTVYGWVPVKVVRRFIKHHGGEK